MITVDASIAAFLAALLKALEDADPDLKKRLDEHKQQLTLEDLVEALKIVKGCRHPNDPDEIERVSLREAKAFLGIED